MDYKDLTDEQKTVIKKVKDGLHISKIVATRAVKTRNGDFFVGMSAAWDTVQEDAGGMGATLIDAMDGDEQHQAVVQGGMSLKEAKIAGCILGMQVDLQATSHALGGGAINPSEYEKASRAIKRNYGALLAEAVTIRNGSLQGK